MGKPPPNPPNPFVARTRWQGTRKGRGFRAMADPTAREAPEDPALRATSP